jgi:hypothetical protein
VTLGGLLLGCISPVFGKSGPAEGIRGNPAITVRVHNYARVRAETLARAEHLTSAIFSGARVRIVWVDCDVDAPVEEREPACNRAMNSLDFVLNLVDRIQPLNPDLREIAMGVAAVPPPGAPGYLAYLSIHQAAGAAQEFSTPLEDVLGLAAAHEIGHLLLGENSHTASGLMMSRWGAAELEHIAWEEFLFSPEQVARIEGNLALRMEKASRWIAALRTGNSRTTQP